MFDYKKVDIVIQRIIQNANPKKIIVFGSVAHREAKDDSDLDLLVLFDTDECTMDQYVLVKRQFIGLMLPSDVFVMTVAQFEHYVNNPQSFTHEIVMTGKVVYEQRTCWDHT